MLHVSARDFQQYAYSLANKIILRGHTYDAILCVTKGGMHLAYYVADILGIKNIRTYCCGSYEDDNTQSSMRVYHQPDMSDLKNSRILIVDDLIDSGKTLKYILDVYADYSCDVAVMYTKKGHGLQEVFATGHVSLFAEHVDVDKETWLSFYYEERGEV